jgi:hypothetical protein
MNIKIANDLTVDIFYKNIDTIYECILLNPADNSWINDMFVEPLFIEKKYQIADFELDFSEAGNYSEVEFHNSILLYENLKHLPAYILTDERFWLWLYLDKFYNIAVQATAFRGSTTLLNQWVFKQGQRRGLFFGVFSRMYFRVALTVDVSSDDKYKFTKYVIDNQERIRNLTWRTYSNIPYLVRGIVKGQYTAESELEFKLSSYVFTDLAKKIARFGSTRLLDAVSEEEYMDFAYNHIKHTIGKQLSEDK